MGRLRVAALRLPDHGRDSSMRRSDTQGGRPGRGATCSAVSADGDAARSAMCAKTPQRRGVLASHRLRPGPPGPPSGPGTVASHQLLLTQRPLRNTSPRGAAFCALWLALWREGAALAVLAAPMTPANATINVAATALRQRPVMAADGETAETEDVRDGDIGSSSLALPGADVAPGDRPSSLAAGAERPKGAPTHARSLD